MTGADEKGKGSHLAMTGTQQKGVPATANGDQADRMKLLLVSPGPLL